MSFSSFSTRIGAKGLCLRKLIMAFIILAFYFLNMMIVRGQDMPALWGNQQASSVASSEAGEKGKRFREGKYAMFIHWGLYSQLANKWKGKTYYGIGEWMMNKGMAGLTTEEYVPVSHTFNPTDFDAKAIVKLAQRAGMKYIIITAKHHDGFAMYNSKVSDFNIVKATPFGRDPMKELSQACAEAGIGFGFYYSHNQDWTTPYGTVFKGDDGLNRDSFESYFRNKCLPQVAEITSQYGPIELVWFDTPGNMKKEYIEELVALVRKNQPNAFISGRVGHGLGDYNTLGDMEIPLRNIEGLWETVDVSNDAWGYAWYDTNWKTPKDVVQRLIGTVARGGTYMLNVGPDGSGRLPAPAQATLLAAGEWLDRYPAVIHKNEPSPWGHALPWGDVTKKDSLLYLYVYDWPQHRELYLPGLKSKIRSVKMLGTGKAKPLNYRSEADVVVVELPSQMGDKLVSVIELELDGAPVVDTTLAIDPSFPSTFASEFAKPSGVQKERQQWMEKFGEWKHVTRMKAWENDGYAQWSLHVIRPGYYQVELSYSGEGRVVWKIAQEKGPMVQNQQNSSAVYGWYPMGWMYFEKPGRYHISVSLQEGNREKVSLSGIRFTPVQF